MAAFAVAVQAIHFAALFLLFGSALFCVYAGVAGRDFERWLARVQIAAALVAFLSALAWWDAVAMEIGDGFSDAFAADLLGAVLLDTEFGRLWTWRLGLIALLGLALLIPPLRRAKYVIVGLAGAALASAAGVGHAAHAGVPEEIQIGAKAVHFLAAGTWLGGLVPLGWVLRRGTRADEWSEIARGVLPRFSSVGYFAVNFILVSGYLLAWAHVQSLDELATNYGWALIAKVSLFTLMAGLALFNRFRLMPAVRGARTLTPLVRTVAAEQALGFLIVVVAALLANLPPPHPY